MKRIQSADIKSQWNQKADVPLANKSSLFKISHNLLIQWMYDFQTHGNFPMGRMKEKNKISRHILPINNFWRTSSEENWISIDDGELSPVVYLHKYVNLNNVKNQRYTDTHTRLDFFISFSARPRWSFGIADQDPNLSFQLYRGCRNRNHLHGELPCYHRESMLGVINLSNCV